MTKNAFTATAIDRAERMAKRSKTVPIPKGMTLAQVADDAGRDQMAWLQVFQALHFLESNQLVTVNPIALDFVRIVRQLASSANLVDTVEEAFAPLDRLLPAGAFAGPFMDNAKKERKPGAVREWVRNYMKHRQDGTAAAAWAALKARPPRGLLIYGDAGHKAAHITTKGKPDTSYRQFANLVSLERPTK